MLWFRSLAIGLLIVSTSAHAEVDDALKGRGWNEFVFDGKTTNSFSLRSDGGIDVLSRGSVSLLQLPVAVDIGAEPALRWRWCVTEPAPATDLSEKGDDDRSLAIYVAFPFVEAEASAFEKLERKIIEKTAGKDAPGRVLMYVWGGDAERGTVVPSPHMGDSAMMKILRPSDTPPGQWFKEQIDIAGDYRAAFGSEPPDPIYLAISADTDDTGSASKGIVKDLEFLAEDRIF